MLRFPIVVVIGSDRSLQEFAPEFSIEPYGFPGFHVFKCENASRV
jgi:hypothetical protein